MADMIRLDRVNKIYGKQVQTQVLHDVSLSIEEHSFTSIIGASGSGKSTLLNIMGTLDRPTTGEVYINGQRTASMKKNKLATLRNQNIGFVFQFHYLLPEFSALENVLMPYLIQHGKISGEIKKRALEIMELIGIEQVKNNLAVNMSGGQQQRTAIARALINNPPIILADEPTGNLDSKSTDVVYDIMRTINEKFKTTFLVITHDRRIAQRADRIIEIKDGSIFLDLQNTPQREESS